MGIGEEGDVEREQSLRPGRDGDRDTGQSQQKYVVDMTFLNT